MRLGDAVTAHAGTDTGHLLASGAGIVLEPSQDAAGRGVEFLRCGARSERTEIPKIAPVEGT